MAKIIQILEINNEILGLGDDGVTYACESTGEWSACIPGLESVEKVAPKPAYNFDPMAGYNATTTLDKG
tara:strand:+ start:250 stop:456 length:207 start_codon:yes stop_codon:yes gene_type:complete